MQALFKEQACIYVMDLYSSQVPSQAQNGLGKNKTEKFGFIDVKGKKKPSFYILPTNCPSNLLYSISLKL
jgi:hypothetical protein